LEITHNTNPQSVSYDTYHPHFHCILAVNKTYFKNEEYIQKSDWTSFWRKAMRLDYDPVVDVRRVKGNTAKAVAEVSKYAVKDSDYIIPDDWQLTVDTVKLLDSVLSNRRLVAYGGKFKDWHRKLNLDDEVDGDLVHIDGDVSVDPEVKELITYVWHTGYNQYFMK
jgi:plasmid rolling circle replication initiator protein Rep